MIRVLTLKEVGDALVEYVIRAERMPGTDRIQAVGEDR